MAQAPRETPQDENFKRVVYVGVGVDRDEDVLTTEAFDSKQEAVDDLLENGCTLTSIRVFEVTYDLRLHHVDDIPLTKLEVR